MSSMKKSVFIVEEESYTKTYLELYFILTLLASLVTVPPHHHTHHTHIHTANTLVRDVILKGLRRGNLGWRDRSPDEFRLKVCGRDEYMDR